MALAATVVLASCSRTKLRQDALDPQGPVARKLHHLITPVFGAAAFVFVLVEALIVVAVIRFRARSDEDRPRQVHGNTRLETTWTILPALMLAVVGLFTVKTIFDVSRRPTGPGVVHVNVTGHRWWWEYDYPGLHVVTANELHIPVDQPIDISLTSVDVIHNFWPPKLSGKIYAIPNRINHMTIQADHPGTYYGQCAEFCGLSHANMRLRVVAHARGDFERWVAANTTNATNGTTTFVTPDAEANPDAAAGATLFRQKGCSGCHSVQGYSAGTLGPDLTHLRQRSVFAGSILDMNDNNLRRWLRDPPAEKPGADMPNLNLSEDEITKLVAFLDTLQ
jgi:cytochrome c oxidase subunit II